MDSGVPARPWGSLDRLCEPLGTLPARGGAGPGH